MYESMSPTDSCMHSFIHYDNFQRIGFGEVTFYLISTYVEEFTDEIGTGLGIAAFVFYVSDCYYWDSSIGMLVRRIWIMSLLCVLVILILTQAAAHPYAPISLYVMLTPLWMFTIKNVCYPDVKAKNFICWLSGPLLFIGGLVFLCQIPAHIVIIFLIGPMIGAAFSLWGKEAGGEW